MAPSYEDEKDATNACTTTLRMTPAAAMLGAKAMLNGGEPATVEMLADATYPTDSEKSAISAFTSGRAKCQALGEAYRAATIPPPIRATHENNYAYTTALFARLYAGQITWGDFNSERTRATLQAVQNIDQTAAQMQAADQARRQQAAAAFSAAMQQQQQIQAQQQLINQQIYQQNRPRTTNCNRFLNQVSCTTY